VGRLFWKFFLSILLAQLTATLAIGGAFSWYRERDRAEHAIPDIDTSPPAQLSIDSAAATLQYGGTEALRELLSNMQRHRVFAVDETGRDLLSRIVKPSMLLEARAMLNQADKRQAVRAMQGKDGHHYLLFQPSAQYLREMPPGEMPGLSPLEAMTPGGGPPPGSAMPGQGFGPGGDGGGNNGINDGINRGGGFRANSAAGNAARFDARGPDMRGPDGHPGFVDPRYRAMILLTGATLASLLFSFLLAWYFSRPIRALRLAFEAASRGDLAPRFAASGRRGDELADLGRDFDRMTDRLRKLMDAQTRLLHDVSHELRSPLARLQAAIGLAHQQPERMGASMERIERESVRMEKLVGELLTLSRLEAGAVGATGDEIRITELVDDIVADASFEAEAQRRRVVVDSAADAVVLGQPDMLGRAIENVVRNAIKYSPEGGTVNIEMDTTVDGRQLRIRVLDRGPGVAEAELEKIFEPFHRGAERKDTDGHGLGLAIARHVVTAHGGGIVAARRDGGGLQVDIVLPLAPA
jgi:signal transduction histidine kinase